MTDIPFVDHWYNVVPDLPGRPPEPRNSEGGDELRLIAQITPKGLSYLGLSRRRHHAIPDEVRQRYTDFGRPTPLTNAARLAAYLETPARIYFKREDVIPSGSFKINTALAQAWAARQEGYDGLVTETGAGQWGLALSVASAVFGLRCRVYMARCSYGQKSTRRQLMELHGADVIASPSQTTEVGRRLGAGEPDPPGSIGTAISEAVEFARDHPSFAYAAGSNVSYVYVHQSVIGIETARQLRALGEAPDVAVTCVGGGSNFAGFVLPLVYGDDAFEPRPVMFACESRTIPRLTEGQYRYDHADPGGLTPLVKSYSLGQSFQPPATHVGGLRQHNGSPIIGLIHSQGLIRARAYSEEEVFEAGRLLARLEGIFPAPESCHCVCGVIDAAREAAERREACVIVGCISGAGALDMAGYQAHPGRRDGLVQSSNGVLV
ncbi:MAG: TrpB-like pyridoxal phosphate-dependent enzyme [Isosphaeraceae bacterium]|nr:TrpB-like pyridoxal phosphate-dependent enzyme [Isosphaeraceae bacterium]